MSKSQRDKVVKVGAMEESWRKLLEQTLAEGKVEIRELNPGQRSRLQTQFNNMKKALLQTFPELFTRYEKVRCFKVPEDGLTFSVKDVHASLDDFWKPKPEFENIPGFNEISMTDQEIKLTMTKKYGPAEAPTAPAKTLEELLESGELWKGK